MIWANTYKVSILMSKEVFAAVFISSLIIKWVFFLHLFPEFILYVIWQILIATV